MSQSAEQLAKLVARLTPDQRAKMLMLLEAAPEAVAVVGVGCRFPGGRGPSELWSSLRGGVDSIREVPADRWAGRATSGEGPAVRRGGFIEEIDRFDAEFFGQGAREASATDPQERVLLEVTWEAIDDAGLPADRLAGTRTGIFVGICSGEYAWEQFADSGRVSAYSATGTTHTFAANRISFLLDARGPSMTVDTACSSSLVAVHLGCQSLRQRESDVALAAGVNLLLSPLPTLAYTRAGALSAEARCKTFDEGADGFVRSEGCGVVVLKRLSDAVRDGDRVYACIRGSAVNHGGRSQNLGTPNGLGQRDVIRDALHAAGVDPATISLVEAHGTGTQLGDPIEVEGLTAVYGVGPGERCALTSIKTNLGHLEGAAGIAGLIKLLLCFEHGEIPPHLHFTKLNPHFSLAGTRLMIPTAVQSWGRGAAPRRAAVSSFGAGGTNAHVILEDGPAPLPDRAAPPRGAVLTLSARSPIALREAAGALRGLLEHEGASSEAFADFAYTAAIRRTHHEHRLAIAGSRCADWARELGAFAEGRPMQGVELGTWYGPGTRKVAFVFGGQGGQFAGMGRELYDEEPAFRAALDRAAAALRPHLPKPLLEVLFGAGAEALLERTAWAQPALFAVQVALAELWMWWGVMPDAVVGHSVGEVAAAHVAGVLTLADAAKLTAERGAVMEQPEARGAMAALGWTAAEVRERLAAMSPGVCIAALNSPRTTVISGEPEGVERLVAEARAAGVLARPLGVPYAFHGPRMEGLGRRLSERLGWVRPSAERVRLYSTVTGAIARGASLGPDHWALNIAAPVRFADAVAALANDGIGAFLEVSPRPTLLAPMSETLQVQQRGAIVAAAQPRGGGGSVKALAALAKLHAEGVAVDWARVHPAGRVRTMPSYSWQHHKRYWVGGPARASREEVDAASPGLVLRRLASPALQGSVFEATVGMRTTPFVGDHRLFGRSTVPAAMYLDVLRAVASQVFEAGASVTIEDVSLRGPLTLAEEGSVCLQVVVKGDGAERPFEILSAVREAATQPWRLHVTGRLVAGAYPNGEPLHPSADASATVELDVEDLYVRAAAQGLEFGPRLRVLASVRRQDGGAIGQLVRPSAVEGDGCADIHPVLLDGCFQVAAAALPADSDGATSALYLPLAFERMRIVGGAGQPSCCRAVLRPAASSSEAYVADVTLLTADGAVRGAIDGLVLRRVARAAVEAALEAAEHAPAPPRMPEPAGSAGLVYELAWRAQATPRDARVSGRWLLLGGSDSIASELASQMEADGADVVLGLAGERFASLNGFRFVVRLGERDDLAALLGATAERGALDGVVHLGALQPTGELDPIACASRAGADLLALAQTLAAQPQALRGRLWVVTRGAQPTGAVDVDPAQASLLGLARVLANEHPALRCTRVDLPPEHDPNEVAALRTELLDSGGEHEVALRPDGRVVARLIHASAPSMQRSPTDGAQTHAITVAEPGVLSSVRVEPRRLAPLEAHEVRIGVHAVGLNFKEVMLSLAALPGAPPGPVDLGLECAGTIEEVGSAVTALRPGERVVALARPCLATAIQVSEHAVARLPDAVGFEEAATLPVAFLTVRGAFEAAGGLRAGDRVLVHAAAGGVGLAAVQWARRAGAEVFATAGSEAKRAFLRAIGIAHVMDSRTLAFAEEVLAATGGRGVDVVLNSLAGEAVLRSMACLAPGGRFIELGVRDLYEDGALPPFAAQKGLRYVAFDLSRTLAESPGSLGRWLSDLMADVGEGLLRPLPRTVFAMPQAERALRYLARARNIGKVVFARSAPVTIHPDAAYLVTGGFGAIGLEVLHWLTARGARYVILVGRRGATTPRAREAVEACAAQGVHVFEARADVADAAALAAVLDGVAGTMPPLRGVFHAAAVLEDGLLAHQDAAARLERALGPKAAGAWNLHRLTRDVPLDFFALFSSVVSLLGSPGQGPYAAANAFVDGLAHHRRAAGLPAVVINWGPWSGRGLSAMESARHGVAQADRAGVLGLEPDDAFGALEQVFASGATQAAVVRMNWARWAQYEASSRHSLTAELVERASGDQAKEGAGDDLRRQFLVHPAGRLRRAAFERFVRDQVARVLELEPETLDPRQPLGSFNFDSLAALELRTSLERSLQLHLSASIAWNYPTVAALVDFLALEARIPLDAEPGPAAHDTDADAVVRLLERIRGTSAEALSQELELSPPKEPAP